MFVYVSYYVSSYNLSLSCVLISFYLYYCCVIFIVFLFIVRFLRMFLLRLLWSLRRYAESEGHEVTELRFIEKLGLARNLQLVVQGGKLRELDVQGAKQIDVRQIEGGLLRLGVRVSKNGNHDLQTHTVTDALAR